MDYERIDFKTGQVLTADALNHMQDGIEAAIKRDDVTLAVYADLVSLRNEGKLKAGKFYRITDYMTTTAQFGTLSAGHPFDVIVLALSKDALAEEAYAVHSERDTEGYFANSNLSAWKIWYSLDNDTAKFAWADAENGKGVIYRMIDEFNNDIPYDFKNILYEYKKGFGYYQWGGNYTFMRNESLDKQIDGVQYYGYTSDAIPSAWSNGNCLITDETPTITSALYNEDGSAISYGGNITSVSLEEKIYYTFAEADDLTGGSYGNEIKPYKKNGVLALNKIVFGYGCQSNTFGDNCHRNSFGNDCSYNTFGDSCHSNTFGHYCGRNFFGNGCYRNIFGGNCRSNTFGDNCYNNTFGGGCSSNTFEYGCQTNTFGDNCSRNSFGNDYTNNAFGNNCSDNIFGNECSINSFGNNCDDNIFGGTCTGNTFGNNCSNNAFGNNCSDNIFGNECSINSFGNNCDDNIFGSGASEDSPTIGYCRYNHFDDGCSYNVIWSTINPSEANPLRNININRGVCGKYDAYNYINIETLNSEHEINVNQIDGIVSVGEILGIRHASLKSLRDKGQLIAGQQYRIIDYVTTTSQADTKSAEHQFDLIVTADDNKTLNEKARAIQHEGDTYFRNSDLNAWEVWYCLDNDSERFAWAGGSSQILKNVSKGIETFTFDSPISQVIFEGRYYPLTVGVKTMINSGPPTYVTLLEDGKSLQVDNTHGYITSSSPITVHFKSAGVIYRMIDEFGNDCPYDFKNIQFKRKITDGSLDVENGEETYCYTFNAYCVDSGAIEDASVIALKIAIDDDYNRCYGNIIKSYSSLGVTSSELNDIVFLNIYEIDNVYVNCCRNTFGYNCIGNTFGNGCSDNSFGDDCHNNSFGDDYQRNTFGDLCGVNTFGVSCYDNTFGHGCQGNTFGNNCQSNTFEVGCSNNSFKNSCIDNKFGNSCLRNDFGNNCESNTFGDDCSDNSIGDRCQRNTFGHGCQGNIFGNNCQSNTFGNKCYENRFYNPSSDDGLGSNYMCNTFDDGVCVIKLDCDTDTTDAIKNYHIHSGVQEVTIYATQSNNVQYEVALNSEGDVKTFCLADLVQ